MLRIRQVLYPTDFSEPAAYALPLAARIAEGYGAELHALHALILHAADAVEADRLFPRMEDALEELDTWAARRMSSHLGDHELDHLVVHEARERGISAAPVILEYAEAHDIDVIVMGTHGRRGLRHLLMGSVAEEVVRHAPCPVITVRSDSGGGEGKWPGHIVAPLDFSEASETGLAYARELAASGAKLDLLHVIEPVSVPDPYLTGAAGFAFDADAARDSVRHALEERALALVGSDLEWEIHIELGRASSRIAEFAAERGADLVVMASHGRTGVDRVLLGSVASGVIRRAEMPVMIVKPFGKNILSDATSGTTL